MSETTRIVGGGFTPADAQAARGIVDDAQPWRINPFGGLDTEEIADTLTEMRLSDPAGAARVEQAIKQQLSPTQINHLSADLETAQGRADRRLVLDAAQIGVDLAGIVDPTGAADVAGAGLSVYRGDYAGAAISLVGLIPYAGDAAKLAKFGKWSDTVLSVAKRAADSPEFAAKALPILRRIGDAIDALPTSILDRMPAGTRAKLDEMKAAIGDAVARASNDGTPPRSPSSTRPSDDVWIVTPNDTQTVSRPNGSVRTINRQAVTLNPDTLRLQGSSPRVGDFTDISGASVEEVVSRVPKDWTLTPQRSGQGVVFSDANGVERLRMHAPNPNAPAGSNSAEGWIIRVADPSNPGRYFDSAGNSLPSRSNDNHIPLRGNPNAGN